MPNNMFRKCRLEANVTLEEARDYLGYSIRQIQRFEAGEQFPPPGTIYDMSVCYKSPQLLRWYRGNIDPIGQKMEPPVLNNVNQSLFARFCKYAEELEEAVPAAQMAAKILMNKERANQCTDQEIQRLIELFEQAVTDVGQVMEEMQEGYMGFFGVNFHSKLMQRHREKMIDRGYLIENIKPALAVAEERAAYGQKNKPLVAAR